jgi:hypothetical protein
MPSWEPLEDRYSNKRPRKILSLDGGGIRGVITLEILAKMENELREKLKKEKEFRLCDYFDYIGGTSTGAIIAAGLSLGMSVKELMKFYTDDGKDMFTMASPWKLWKSLYRSESLERMLQKTFGHDTNLDISNGKIKCLLTVVTMNRNTDSPWPITNNPFAKYNDKSRADCNLNIKLHQLIRASTAAPIYFPSEILNWDPLNSKKKITFVDGGVTPYNNPSFLLYKIATQPAYNLNWETGENNLLIVSVGTGSHISIGKYRNLFHTIYSLPTNLMYAMEVDQDINCRAIGRCTYGAKIDRELENMVPMDNKGNVLSGKQKNKADFLYVRYNADLSQDGLNLLNLNHIKANKVQKMNSVKSIKELREVGKAIAEDQVDLSHFESFI